MDQVMKAGKKASPYQEPPPPNPEKKKARDLGEQQFHTDKQLTVPATKVVVDKKTGRVITKVYDEAVPFLFDPTRKRFIYSPLKEER